MIDILDCISFCTCVFLAVIPDEYLLDDDIESTESEGYRSNGCLQGRDVPG